MRSLTRSKVAVVGATLVFAVVASLTLSLGSSGASATGLTLTHASIVIGTISVALDALYAAQPVLTGDAFYSEHFDVFGGLPIGSLEFMVDLLTPGSHITILLIVVVLGACNIILHGPFLLNSVGGSLNYHTSISVNPLVASQVLYVDCSLDERNLVLGALHGGPVLAHFLLAH